MCPTLISRYAGILLSLLLVMLVMPSPGATATGSRQQASPPQRLRLKVRENTIKVGGETTFTVEFLDRNYGQVRNDQTRKIKLWQAPVTKAKGVGEIRPEEIIVKPGDWSSADITFASKQPGRLLIKASSDGLEEAQALVVIAGQRASILSDLLEWIEPTTAAAAAPGRLEFLFINSDAPANAKSPITFNLLTSSASHEPLSVRLRVPGAFVRYNGETRFGFANITIDKGEDTSKEIELTSDRSGEVQIQASVEPGGLTEQAKVEFIKPKPQSIYLDDMLPAVPSNQREVTFTVKLADQDKVPASSDSEQFINLSSPDNPDIVEFENRGALKMLANQEFIRTTLHLKRLPANAEISLLAKDTAGSLRPDFKSLKLESPVHKLALNGPIEVNRGDEAELTITLTDASGTPQPADWERRIYLTADAGQVTPSEVVIPRDQERVSVKYLSPDQVGKYNLRADSHGIAQVTLPMNVVTPAYLLLTFAIFGALIGGAVQHARNGTLKRILPRWTGECWELGISGYIFGSTVSGLIFYILFRLGLSRALGSPALPAGFDMGTKTAAFFFGVIGGFAGIVVLQWLVSSYIPKAHRPPEDEVAKATAATT